MKTKREVWIIEDWMGNHIFTDRTFPSFEDARAFIWEYAEANAENEDDYNGICEDLYAERIES